MPEPHTTPAAELLVEIIKLLPPALGDFAGNALQYHDPRAPHTLLRLRGLFDQYLQTLVYATASFQSRVAPWMMDCFSNEVCRDVVERNHRFLEEALELVQARGCSRSEAHQLVDYVFGRDIGEPEQEVGGVMVTLAALCLAAGIDMHEQGEVELRRVSTPAVIAKIQAKQAAKPRFSPLPGQPEASPPAPDAREATLREIIGNSPEFKSYHSSLGPRVEAAAFLANDILRALSQPPANAREETMFLDREGEMIHVGDVIRAPVSGNVELHGTWADYTIEKAPGGYKLSYLISEKGQCLPIGYTGGYMPDVLPESDEHDLKTLVFTKKPIRVDGWEIIRP